ncbi:MAG: metallopeptidase family protein [Planctomycetes bacterium]|nr:metallopeptidase family protein [Planctomycetota bacterium]
MKQSDFKNLVAESLKNLPRVFRQKMKDVEIVIQDEPTSRQATALTAGPPDRPSVRAGRKSILGLYEGVPLSERTHLYGGVLPDKITIFQQNIERICRTGADIKKLVRQTVMHELAHHFGISDQRLRDIGRY